ncbi:hypothetical protein ANN_02039 [Periplaneta americana]|uniref:Uncharacterized protein n=1 Tax=Periplaneta americana TaxID=6978 RepID=A0ABQ8TV58_PERAM|nr:hypothetical protein ANN_02039 [Periplaneta americana]
MTIRFLETSAVEAILIAPRLCSVCKSLKHKHESLEFADFHVNVLRTALRIVLSFGTAVAHVAMNYGTRLDSRKKWRLSTRVCSVSHVLYIVILCQDDVTNLSRSSVRERGFITVYIVGSSLISDADCNDILQSGQETESFPLGLPFLAIYIIFSLHFTVGFLHVSEYLQPSQSDDKHV